MHEDHLEPEPLCLCIYILAERLDNGFVLYSVKARGRLKARSLQQLMCVLYHRP